MRAVTIDSDLATLFTFTPRKPPKTPIQEVEASAAKKRLPRNEDPLSSHAADAAAAAAAAI